MSSWLKSILSRRQPDPLPTDRDLQNQWIMERLHEWQLAWHDLFDPDPLLIAAGEFGRPDPLPKDTDSDYRLIFGLSRATPQTRAACFALFPSGDKIDSRFDSFLTTRPVQMPEPEARTHLAHLLDLIDRIGPNEEVDLTTVNVVDRDTPDGLAALNYADDITVLLEGSLLEPKAPADLPVTAARLFLSEPLYASAGNYYQLRDWVCSAMTGGPIDEVQSLRYQMWDGGWQVMFNEDGVILARRKV